ncbi:hypothetical protein OX462_12305 [Janthinobacterium sp. SUN098]|uniref:hypothetical protein n=1 Tax=Janthinobacterium sp. SUN098 TaxID=3002437 RepID=UPI0038D4C692
MEPTEQNDKERASPDELRQAIERLTAEELYKLAKAAGYYLFGSEYQKPSELLNEAILRAMNAAIGGQGRAWKTSIDFFSFLMMCMKGIASDSANSVGQKRTLRIDALATETLSGEDFLGARGFNHRSTEDQVEENQEIGLRQAIAKSDSDAIDQFFKNDENVSFIIMGYKDEMPAEEIRAISGMSSTEYDTAKRRFRRGLDKIFPGRRSK